jgi:hypothetical protein
MGQFSGGWMDLANSLPSQITDIIAFSMIGVTPGIVKLSSNYNLPNSSWVNSPLTITSNPVVVAVNAAQFPNEGMLANAMNAQTQSANISGPPALKNLIYVYGNNPGELKYEIDIPINLGGLNYNSIQISILDNAGTNGNFNEKIQVIDFGTGPWTGAQTLKALFSNFIGEVHIGIRLNDTSNNTSIFDLRTVILPISNNLQLIRPLILSPSLNLNKEVITQHSKPLLSLTNTGTIKITCNQNSCNPDNTCFSCVSCGDKCFPPDTGGSKADPGACIMFG